MLRSSTAVSVATVQSVIGDRATSLIAERRAEEEATRPSRATSLARRFAAAVSAAVTSVRWDRERVTASARLDTADGLIGGVASLATTGAVGRRFTTVWGADPVFASNAGVPGGPYTFHFPRAVATETVTLAEVDDLVTVVGHRPECVARRVWLVFAADAATSVGHPRSCLEYPALVASVADGCRRKRRASQRCEPGSPAPVGERVETAVGGGSKASASRT